MADTAPSLDDLAENLAIAQQRAEILKQAIEEFRQEIVNRLSEQGLTSTTTAAGRRITIVAGQTTSWDQDVLKDVLVPLGLWERVSVVTEVLDEQALERLVDQGAISPSQLQEAMTVKERRPYPRITDTKTGGTPS